MRPSTQILSAELSDSGCKASLSVPGRQCTRCGETHVDATVLRSFELAVARELANGGVDTGEAFRRMRKALGLRAMDLAQLLDLTPETISHWETGKVVINRAAFVAVGAMVQDAIDGRTMTRDRLAALGKRQYPRVLSPKLV